MKEKTIKKVLNQVFKKFLESIDDAKIRKVIEQNALITGGSIASMLLQEKVNDYDIYFRTREAAFIVAEHFIKQLPSEKQEHIKVVPKDDRIYIKVQSYGIVTTKERSHYKPKCVSSNAITLTKKIQLIFRFFGEPDEIHSNYDFIHCTNYWTAKEDDLVLRPEALTSLLTKELKYIGSKYPLASIIRTRKFIRRGFAINAGQYLKMCYQLNELDLKNYSVLFDQLMGVDAAYFYSLIQELQNENPDKVDSNRLMELVDKYF